MHSLRRVPSNRLNLNRNFWMQEEKHKVCGPTGLCGGRLCPVRSLSWVHSPSSSNPKSPPASLISQAIWIPSALCLQIRKKNEPFRDTSALLSLQRSWCNECDTPASHLLSRQVVYSSKTTRNYPTSHSFWMIRPHYAFPVRIDARPLLTEWSFPHHGVRVTGYRGVLCFQT